MDRWGFVGSTVSMVKAYYMGVFFVEGIATGW